MERRERFRMDTPSLETLSRENESITQKLYLDQLRIVRVTLFVIGAIALVVNWYRFANVPTEVSAIMKGEIRALGPDVVVEQEEIESWKEGAIYQGRLIFGISACLGLGFILLGIFIYRAPVLVTLAGLFFFCPCTVFTLSWIQPVWGIPWFSSWWYLSF